MTNVSPYMSHSMSHNDCSIEITAVTKCRVPGAMYGDEKDKSGVFAPQQQQQQRQQYKICESSEIIPNMCTVRLREVIHNDRR